MALYESVGWTNYTDRPEMLKQAFDHSLYILAAYDDDKMVGIVRVVGDGFSIVYIQDVLVLPVYQRMGIGTALIGAILEKYPNVYQISLMTDNTEKTISFYESLGFILNRECGCAAFLKSN